MPIFCCSFTPCGPKLKIFKIDFYDIITPVLYTWLLQVVLGLLLGFFANCSALKSKHTWLCRTCVHDGGISNEYDAIYLLEI